MGFAVCTALISMLEIFPKLGISDRLMTLCIPLANNTHLTIIRAYAPMMTYANDEKEAFYQVLINTIHATLNNDKLLLLTSMPMSGATALHGHQYLDPTAWERRTLADTFC